MIQTAISDERQSYYPLAAAYLGEANNLMQATILPAAQGLYTAENQRLTGDLGSAQGTWLVALAGVLLVLTLVLLVVVQVWMSRHFRRTFNLWLVAATIATFVLGVWFTAAVVVQSSGVDAATSGGSAPLVLFTEARIGALRMTADDELTLVTQDSGSRIPARLRDHRAVVGPPCWARHASAAGTVERAEIARALFAIASYRLRARGDPAPRRNGQAELEQKADGRRRHRSCQRRRRLSTTTWRLPSARPSRRSTSRCPDPPRTSARFIWATAVLAVAAAVLVSWASGPGSPSTDDPPRPLPGRAPGPGGRWPARRSPLRPSPWLLCARPTQSPPRAIGTPRSCPQGPRSVHPTATPADPTNCTASYPPPATMPTPGQMPAGTWMAHIKARGHLIAGVAQTTDLWAYRNPGTAQLEGFDIDMIEQVNLAIFGPQPPAVVFKMVPNADRSEAVATGQVDLVAETMTINCARQTKSAADPYPVDFSTVYYERSRAAAGARGLHHRRTGNLGHRRVCAVGGADSFDNLVNEPGDQHIVAWNAPNWADCLLMLQQGQVDAIATDNAILLGLQAPGPKHQDRGARVQPRALRHGHQQGPPRVHQLRERSAGRRAGGRHVGRPLRQGPVADHQGRGVAPRPRRTRRCRDGRTRSSVDRRIADLRAIHERIAQNLVELDADVTRQMLDSSTTLRESDGGAVGRGLGLHREPLARAAGAGRPAGAGCGSPRARGPRSLGPPWLG